MPKPENIIPPKKGERRNPNGRPKKFVSAVLDSIKAEGYQEVTPSQVKQIYTTLIALPQERLKGIATDVEMPMLYRIVAKEILDKKGFEVIEKMLDRAHGKPTQKSEMEVSGNIKLPAWLTGEDLPDG